MSLNDARESPCRAVESSGKMSRKRSDTPDGKAITRAREQKRWHVSELAAEVEVSIRTIQNAENGLPIEKNTLMSIAKALDVEYESIIDASENRQFDCFPEGIVDTDPETGGIAVSTTVDIIFELPPGMTEEQAINAVRRKLKGKIDNTDVLHITIMKGKK